MRGEPEHDDSAQHDGQRPSRANGEDEQEHDHRVEEEPRVVLRVLGREELEGDVDHDRADDDAGQAPDAAEDHDRVDRDQDRQREVPRGHGGQDGGEDAARKPGDAGSEGERHQLQPIDRNAHRLGREWVLAQRAPGAAGARLAEEVQADQDEQDDAEDEPVLLAPRRQLVAEEVVRVDVRDPVRPSGQSLAVHGRIRRVDEDDERLAEEEGHDREVVAEQPARGDAEHEAQQRRADHDDRDRDRRGPVDAVVLRREQRVEVRAEAEERHVAQVEQPGIADDDVQPEAEQDVDQREDPVGKQVAAVHPERQRGGERAEDGQARPGREEGVDPPAEAGEPDTILAAILDARDPLVDAHARAIALVGPARHLGDVSSCAHQTFWIAGVPRRPLGRMSRTRIRIPKTVRSDQRPPR